MLKVNKENIPIYIFIAIIILSFYFIINIFSYFRPIDMCYIKIKGQVTSRDRSIIKKTIKIIKKEDRSAYRDLCKYVDVINERYCIVADHHIDMEKVQEGWAQAGCYVQGSKTIYVKPEIGDATSVAEKRVGTVKKYTEYSKNFWTKN